MKRRSFLKGLTVTAPLAAVATPALLNAKEAPKSPNAMDIKSAVNAVTGGKAPAASDKVDLTVPEIAENGAVVPVKVNVDHPMEDGNYVKGIHIFATENANVRCADVMLTPMNANAYFGTRIKLGKSQKVMALVALSNGEFIMAEKPVKVTIGGCG